MALLMSLGMSAQQSKYSHTVQAEKLDRGVVAVKADKGVFVSWRSLLGDDKYPMLMRPEAVAARLVRAVEHGRRSIVIDRRYALLVGLWRLIPRWLWERLPIRTRR